MGFFCTKYHFFTSSFASFLSASPTLTLFPSPAETASAGR